MEKNESTVKRITMEMLKSMEVNNLKPADGLQPAGRFGMRRSFATNSERPPLLFENDAPDTGEWFSNCYIDRYDYMAEDRQNGAFQINLSAQADMREVCQSINIKYYIKYTGEGTRLWLIHEEQRENLSSLRCAASWDYMGTEEEIANMSPYVEFRWQDTKGSWYACQEKEHILPNGEELVDNYQHAWPKKEEKALTFRPQAPTPTPVYDSGTVPVPAFDPADPKSYVTVALLREPDDRKDCDYVCYVGRYPGTNKPYIEVPVYGKFTAARYWKIKNLVREESFCLLTKKGGLTSEVKLLSDMSGDYSENSFVFTPSEDGKTAVFSLITQWKDYSLEPGGMQRVYYDFDIQLIVDFESLNEKGKTVQAVLHLTSRHQSGVEKLKAIKDDLYPVAIMWGCVSENTSIIMADGSQRKISDIRIGDQILSGDGRPHRVFNVWRGVEDSLLKITAENGGFLETTASHPILTERGFVRAGGLKAGDFVKGADGELLKISSVEAISGDFRVCNLDVESSDGQGTMLAAGIVLGDNSIQNSEL